jgi:hypothetical protein
MSITDALTDALERLVLDSRERIPAFEVIAFDKMWAVLLDDFVPAVGEIPRVLVFPREQDARDFVAKINAGVAPHDALMFLRGGD